MALFSMASAVLLLTSLATATSDLHPLSDEFISLINSQQNSWKAGRNFPRDTPRAYLKKIMGVVNDDSIPNPPVKVHDAELIASLPEHFDPRKKWPNCPSLNEIIDQGNCGSCWAFGAVAAMTDRACIHSNGTKHFHFSGEDLISCVKAKYSAGCKGGSTIHAWYAWRDIGIVSGGPYNSSEGCMPYLLAPCEHHVNGTRNPCLDPMDKTPKCVSKCQANYDVEYEKDKARGKNIALIKNEDIIKAELFQNGPTEAILDVHEDFLSYKTGVYSFTKGDMLGFHAAKMLGWGEEDGKKYWLMANSWNSDWGDKGYFKILRGTNECGIEGFVVAGDPDLDSI